MSHKLLFMYRVNKVQFSDNVPGLAVKTNVFLYKNYTDDSQSSKLYKKLRRG